MYDEAEVGLTPLDPPLFVPLKLPTAAAAAMGPRRLKVRAVPTLAIGGGAW
jgi:hypothetical protein